MLHELMNNILHNMFKPLLLFFYAGFFVPILGVKLEFPKQAYQALTIYLLLAIGWHGGEELASLEPALYGQAAGFMVLGFGMNLVIGLAAYAMLRWSTRLRQIDAATVAGYYGSDSAGTFVTCLGVLTAANIAFAPYMPVMLAVMEIPGCLVALFLVSKMRGSGMDAAGNMPGEAGYQSLRSRVVSTALRRTAVVSDEEVFESELATAHIRELVGVGAEAGGTQTRHRGGKSIIGNHGLGERNGHTLRHSEGDELDEALESQDEISLQTITEEDDVEIQKKAGSWLNGELLHEVFLNPGIFLLFGGIAIGLISRIQGNAVTLAGDNLFNTLFQGLLCLFLLEMGITASQKLKDLRTAGWRFVAFALIAPNVFATAGMLAAHVYSLFLGQPFDVGTYVLFAVLCGAASYIAVPAVQRLAIPEASPTLPLAASLGVTFSYNVTVGIPVYLMIAQLITRTMPVYASVGG